MIENDSVIILSGGLDSTTLLAYLISSGHRPAAITFNYRQRNCIEVKYAQYQAKKYDIKEHIIFSLPMDIIKGSSLTDRRVQVEKGCISRKEIPNTYVPSRNIIFLSIAVSLAEAMNITGVFTGINSVDYSGYPDCRPEFIKSYNKMIQAGTRSGTLKSDLIVVAPFIKKRKIDIIKIGMSLGVDYSRTFSCYNPHNNKPCRTCDSCLFRADAFSRLSICDENIIYGGVL